jgi:hypothetical protein
MAGGTVTINGTGTTVTGNLGAIGAIAGPGSNYTVASGAVVTTSAQHKTDFTKAFNGLAAMTPTATLSGSILGTTPGATTLTPGIYKFDSTAQLTGTRGRAMPSGSSKSAPPSPPPPAPPSSSATSRPTAPPTTGSSGRWAPPRSSVPRRP